MTQQTLNNNETGKAIRDKINENFDEAYSGIVNNKVVPDGGTIGSETTPDAMTISSDGGVEFAEPVMADITTLDLIAQANDVDFGGYYLTQLQNIPDLAAKGAGYWFDGVDDYILFGDITDVLSQNKGSIHVRYKCTATTGAEFVLVAVDKLSSGVVDEYRIVHNATNERININVIINGGDNSLVTSSCIALNDTTHDLIVTSDGSTVKIYVDGNEVTVTGTNIGQWFGDLVTDADEFVIGAFGRNGSYLTNYLGEIYITRSFNLALIADEAKALSSGAPVPFKWLPNATDKPGELRNSGNFAIGAAYIITTRTDGDFQSAGAADDNVGTEFIATATAAGVLDGGDTATRLGAVLQLEQPGIGHNQWIDISGNELHGEVSGAFPTNLPANHIERCVKKAVTGETAFTIPTGYAFVGIAWENTTANQAGNVNFGWSDDGQQIVADVNLAGNTIGTLILLQRIAVLTPGSMDVVYISSDDWNGSSIDFYITFERLT